MLVSDYPAPLVLPLQLSKVPTAILSTTNKARERMRKKEEAKKTSLGPGSITAAALEFSAKPKASPSAAVGKTSTCGEFTILFTLSLKLNGHP